MTLQILIVIAAEIRFSLKLQGEMNIHVAYTLTMVVASKKASSK